MKTRKIESFDYKAEVMVPLQGTDPNKNPKHLKYEKWCWTHHSVVHPLKSEISLAVRQLPELLQAHPAVTRLQRYLVSNLKARYLSVLIGMNPEKSNLILRFINQCTKKRRRKLNKKRVSATWSQCWNILWSWLLSTSPWTSGHWICNRF